MSLYRKYRPQTFEGVTGQHHVVTPLRNQVKTDAMAHAYLFSGPRGIGKTTLARILAKASNCLDLKEGEPCGACLSCEAIQDGSALDIIEIDAASNTGVDNVRDNIIESVRFAPTTLKKKVFIIDEVHMLSKGAFNALLKTLEEPPAYVMFILATTELHKIPDTIISRCQRFDFTKISPELMVARLKMMAGSENIKIADDVLYEIARRSGGCQRDAEGLLGQVMTIGETDITLENASVVLPIVDISHVLELIGAMAKKDAALGVRLVNHVLESGSDLLKLTDSAIDIARSVLLAKVSETEIRGAYSKEQLTEIGGLVDSLSVDRVREILSLLLRARSDHKNFHMPQLALELAVVDACQGASPVIQPAAPVQAQVQTPVTTPAPAPVQARVVEPERAQETATTPSVEPAVVAPIKADEIVEPVNVSSEAGPVTLETIKKYWSTFLKNVREKHASLPLALEMSEPVRVEGNKVFVKVQFGFYAETLNASSNNELLSGVMSEIIGSLMLVQGEHESMTESDPNVAAVMNAFGGEVVS